MWELLLALWIQNYSILESVPEISDTTVTVSFKLAATVVSPYSYLSTCCASTPKPITRIATRMCLAVISARMAGIAPKVQNQPVTSTVIIVARICVIRKRRRFRSSLSPRATRGVRGGGASKAMQESPGRKVQAKRRQDCLSMTFHLNCCFSAKAIPKARASPSILLGFDG